LTSGVSRAWWPALGLALAASLVLRLWGVHDVPGNSFYDAAVRSMGQSPHAFFFGALEPSGTISIDKPPLDLWLQVISTSLLGFGLVGLHLPEVLGGVCCCALLFCCLYRPFGSSTALVAVLLAGTLPVSVLTARSDTMDSLMAALQIAALWLSWIALSSKRTRWSILAAAVAGLAFNVKLTESLLVLPALLLLWTWAAPPARRLRTLLLTLAAYAAVCLSWAAVASLTPASSRPIPIGSQNGSIWRMIFVFNGLDRFDGHGVVGVVSGPAGGAPGPLRLLGMPGSYGSEIGIALAAQGRARLRAISVTPKGRLIIALAVWLICGLVFFSFMRRLQLRYLEAFTPPLCALLAISLVILVRDRRAGVRLAFAGALIVIAGYLIWLAGVPIVWTVISVAGLCAAALLALTSADATGRLALAAAAVGLLGVSVGTDFRLISAHRSDSVLNDPTSPAMSRYLLAHRHGARFEVASANVFDITGLVARDGQSVVVLNDLDGELQRVASLAALVADGQVRFYYASHGCHTGRHCAPNEKWAYLHSQPVPGYAGLRSFSR
jgi:4-amino-4-deoxy-L-arabinose transferase-like glycosyltransferase